jgi:uncharacterized membrane protein YccC
MKAFLVKYRTPLSHCLRVTAAALAAYGVNLALDFQQGYWMAFTAILVVQSSVGGSVKAALERMTGTFAGAAYGALIGTVMPHTTPAEMALTVAAGLAPAAFAAALSPSFRIAPITVAILLFSNTAHTMTPLVFAEHRVAEIGLGCVIGLAVSLIVLPSRAHHMLAVVSGQVLSQLAHLLSLQARMAARSGDQPAVDAQFAQIRTSIAKLDVMKEEARRERASYLTGEPDPEPLLRMIRRVRNDLIIVGRAVMRPLPEEARPLLLKPLEAIATIAGNELQAIAVALTGRGPLPPPKELEAALGGYMAAMSALQAQQVPGKLPGGDMGRIFTLGFALEQLQINMMDLSARATEFIEGDRPEN